MRLIDVDKLPVTCNVIIVDGQIELTGWIAAERITEAPTVKAIPIETIKKEIERLKEDIKWAWYYGNTALDKMEYLKMWLEIKLEDWEKENGVN